MELKEFIKETISSINKAVYELQLNPVSNESINPGGLSCGLPSDRTSESGTTRKVSVVEFDIVLSNNGEDSGKNGIGVWFANMGVGSSSESTNGHSQTTSVKFAIPIVYPYRE